MARASEYPNPQFADRLREAIETQGFSQSTVANWCGKERKSICAWVNCVTYPSAGDLAHMCKHLNVSADYLLFGEVK